MYSKNVPLGTILPCNPIPSPDTSLTECAFFFFGGGWGRQESRAEINFQILENFPDIYCHSFRKTIIHLTKK